MWACEAALATAGREGWSVLDGSGYFSVSQALDSARRDSQLWRMAFFDCHLARAARDHVLESRYYWSGGTCVVVLWKHSCERDQL